MRLTGLILIALGLWLFWLYQNEEAYVAEPLMQTPPVGAQIPIIPELSDGSEYSEIVDRPLFHPQRSAPVVIESEPEPIAPPRIRLSAIIISNSVRVAVVQELESNQTHHVRQGDELNDWTIEKVSRNSVILRLKDQTIIIPLFGDG
jgi:hypothetical protein